MKIQLLSLCLFFQLAAGSQAQGNHVRRKTLDFSSRIINGEDTVQGRYPWMVWYLFAGQTTQCGGSMIAPDLVLTNGHCYTEGSDLGHAYINKWNTANGAEGMPIRPVVEYIPHPDYVQVDEDGNYYPDNDIAILKLDRAPNRNFGVIKLNYDASYPSDTGEELYMLGWGSLTNGVDAPLEMSDILQQASTSYIAAEECEVARDPELGIGYETSPGVSVVGPDWLCTNDESHAHCNGDSGGPIIRLGATADDDLLVGVIAGDSGGCDNIYLPLINQRVSYHIDWIKEVGCEKSDNPPAEWNCDGASTSAPTIRPTRSPTNMPTGAPVVPPTMSPTSSPTSSPTKSPTMSPTASPTGTTPTSPNPTLIPTSEPTSMTRVPEQPFETSAPTDGDSVPTSFPTLSEGTLPPNEFPTASPVDMTEEDTEAPTETPTKVPIYVKIIFDDMPQHIGWYIADANYSRFRVAVPIGAYLPTDLVANDVVYVEEGEPYQFVISDRAGDGLAGSPPGSFEVYLGEDFDFEVLASGSGNFGYNSTFFFDAPCINDFCILSGNFSDSMDNATEVPVGTPAPKPTPSPVAKPTAAPATTAPEPQLSSASHLTYGVVFALLPAVFLMM
eukprot:Nitzschia sp. Nitz4//scaffold108_size72880//43760//45816//NITZ4_005819-RA/size72880-processed-gene-0.39-mRNA-1//1//CDS//3329532681//1043//frame0